MYKAISVGSLAAVFMASSAMAQQPVYAQCGGINWTGGKTCVSGTTCTVINDYYYQCLPGSSSPTTTSRITSATSATSVTSVTRTVSVTSGTASATSVPPPTSTVGPSDNPYSSDYTVWLSPYYAAEVAAAVKNISDSTLAAKAAKVANIPTFTWFDVKAKVPTLGEYLADAQAKYESTGKKQIVQIVVYDLPGRDCHALASNGELALGSAGEATYKQYIDDIAAWITKYPQVRVVAVVEPDSLANLVTNLSDQRCANAKDTYTRMTIYAIQKLSQPNIYLYLDAGHAGWLGWPANITPAAQLFGDLLKSAGGAYRVRGLATNVSNYNALVAASPDPVTPPNQNYDEQHYISALAPLLVQNNFPAHFIIDQGRAGVQNIRDQWGNWCNIEGAGFGARPGASSVSNVDQIVWIKPGGESDGTSDTSAVRYDSTCGLNDAKKPAPEAGAWFQAYFVDLVKNASPAL
ncbi:glycoside hydrolase family 6 protein [Ceratobasidium sp. AG-Ba]|nr:glycoside hydrolase family 6 protein [Ceratobasidium sp. AG-Ba]